MIVKMLIIMVVMMVLVKMVCNMSLQHVKWMIEMRQCAMTFKTFL